MASRQEWAFEELDRRRAEDRLFPVEPEWGTSHWHEFARMKRRRAMRRKAMGYSRQTATDLVAWAERIDGCRA